MPMDEVNKQKEEIGQLFGDKKLFYNSALPDVLCLDGFSGNCTDAQSTCAWLSRFGILNKTFLLRSEELEFLHAYFNQAMAQICHEKNALASANHVPPAALYNVRASDFFTRLARALEHYFLECGVKDDEAVNYLRKIEYEIALMERIDCAHKSLAKMLSLLLSLFGENHQYIKKTKELLIKSQLYCFCKHMSDRLKIKDQDERLKRAPIHLIILVHDRDSFLYIFWALYSSFEYANAQKITAGMVATRGEADSKKAQAIFKFTSDEKQRWSIAHFLGNLPRGLIDREPSRLCLQDI